MSNALRSVCYFLLLLLSTGCGCSSGNKPPYLNCATGKLPSPDNKYDVFVTIDTSHYAIYEIRAIGSSVTLAQGRVGSAYHKFFLMWDDKDNLWISGEEEGQVIFHEDGKFRPHVRTLADYKDPDFPKEPAGWNDPATW